MSYRDDDDALRHLRDDLEREESRVAEALARARRDLAEREAKKAPVHLANLRVAAPCHESWADMTGDERARQCAKCDQTVFDLSSMTTEEAEALLAGHHTRLCVRFYRRGDGTVMTADCPVGGRQRRRKLAIAAGAVAATAAFGSAVAALMGGGGRGQVEQGGAQIHEDTVQLPAPPAPPPNEQLPHQRMTMGMMERRPAPPPAPKHGKHDKKDDVIDVDL